MSLKKYKEKRNFEETTEPVSGHSSGGELHFVVQRHHATALHYDFRLEMDGVLKSWAVPKGPSLNPKDKRLALMVEDHPYDYRTFEGIIPKGNYGAGVVNIFDEGTYEPLEKNKKALKKGLEDGNLKFSLHGKILKGEFALVKLKDSAPNTWLLIKHQDKFAVNTPYNSEDLVPEKIKKMGIDFKKKDKGGKLKKPAPPLPKKQENNPEISFKPMLAKLSSSVFDDDDWLYEKKLDGYRSLAYLDQGSVKLISRSGLNFGNKYPSVQKALSKIDQNAVIDGELVVEDKNGQSLFQELQNYDSNNKKLALKYYVFDLLYLNGHDLRSLPLIQRKELLKILVGNLSRGPVIYNEYIQGKGTKLLQKAKKENWEGIVAKKASSSYESNKRSAQWQKFKLHNSQEALICGFTQPAGSRKHFGALVLGIPEGKKIKYIGNCGTGFTDTGLKELYDKMIVLKTDKKPFEDAIERGKKPVWIKPKLVCEVVYTEWTQEKHLRHPVFKGLRMDKKPDEVKPEIAEILVEENQKQESSEKYEEMETQNPNEKIEYFGRKKLVLTNLNKIYWPKERISKEDLLNYYRDVSAYILPWLKDRPLSLNRYPNGIDKPSFFQKNLNTDQIPAWIKYAPMYSESNAKNIDFLICNDLASLLWMVNLGCIEINPWLSTYKKPENPDFAVIDLDPQDVDFKLVVEAAQVCRQLIEQLKLKPFIKTSGSRGLHIFIPMGARYQYEQTKMFVEFLVRHVHAVLPETTSIVRDPAKRRNLIYLDYLQNRRGQTIAATYSVRPKAGATVSTPLSWDEVNENLNPSDFTIFNTLQRLKEKEDPWKNIWTEKSDLKKALKMVEGLKK